MRLLGIDYGRAKMGFSFAAAKIAEPYSVIHFNSVGDSLSSIRKIVEKEQIEKIVLGVSENAMGEETREFAKKLQNELGKEVILADETLSTQDAQALAIAAGLKRRKRKNLEDAFAATVMLQLFIDSNV